MIFTMGKIRKKNIVNSGDTSAAKHTLVYCVCLFLSLGEVNGGHSPSGQTLQPTTVNFSLQVQHTELEEDSVTTNYGLVSTIAKPKLVKADYLSDVTTVENGGSSHDVTPNPGDAKEGDSIARDTAHPGQINEETTMAGKIGNITEVFNRDDRPGLHNTDLAVTTIQSLTEFITNMDPTSNSFTTTSQTWDTLAPSYNMDCATDIRTPTTIDGKHVIKMMKTAHNNSATNMTTTFDESICVSRMVVPTGNSVNVFFNNTSWEPSYRCSISVSFCFHERKCFMIEIDARALESYHRVRGRKTNIKLSAQRCSTFGIEIHYTPVPDALFDTLPVVNTSSNSGYIISPGFDVNKFYPVNVNMTLPIHVASDEVILLSFPHFYVEDSPRCRYDWLQLTSLNASGNQLLWLKCGQWDSPSQVFHDSILLRFISDNIVTKSGFKILYTILPRSQEPELLSVDNEPPLFNCSVPHLAQFAHHFNCNLAVECFGAEDEAQCPYSSPDCGPGFIEAKDKCYQYSRVRANTSWSDASSYCRTQNQTLVNPSDPAQWERFKDLMVGYGKLTSTVFTGLRTSQNRVAEVASLYRDMWQWSDLTMALYANVSATSQPSPVCSYFRPAVNLFNLMPVFCLNTFDGRIVCERVKEASGGEDEVPPSSGGSVLLPSLQSNYSWSAEMAPCPSGNVVRDYLSCDQQSQCQRKRHGQQCDTQGVSLFLCEHSTQSVHYTLTCDFRIDCPDGSDEDFCKHLPCKEDKCRSGKCIASSERCDGMQHCGDGSDENCPQMVRKVSLVPPPAIVQFDGKGGYSMRALEHNDSCPDTHFHCTRSHYCLPVYVRCNGVYDCPDQEDEMSCETFQCPGFFRCRGSTVCLHPTHVCDGVFQCPQHDDELLCGLPCPEGCQCRGLAFVCKQRISPADFPSLRYLDASGSGMKMGALAHNAYLIFLRLANCHIEYILPMDLENLRTLDLSYNLLTRLQLDSVLRLENLRTLYLVGNPLVTIVAFTSPATTRPAFRYINLSGTLLTTINASIFSGFPGMTMVNFSRSRQLTSITDDGFKAIPGLLVVDLRGCPSLMSYPTDLLQGLDSLTVVYADDYRLCCEAALPATFDMDNCHAPTDDIASCDDLLRSVTFRVFLWAFAFLAVLGNAGSFFTRFYIQNESFQSSFNVFVTNLSVADFLMGVYLTMIGVADQVYKGRYLWQGDAWKNSAACQTAGFLSLLSTEVSAFFICLITLDRFLVLRFPFSKVHFSKKSALVACGIAWFTGFVLAVVPLLPMTSHWKFYSQTGICIPLPFFSGEDKFPGHSYSFGVMIVLNFVQFLLIAVGQIVIYMAVKSGTQAKRKSSRDVAIARRLTTIVLSDFLCWFPIGLLGLLAFTGTPIPTDVNVGVAIFVLPFNSALNPFLYTFNIVMEKRRKAVEARMLQRLETRHITEMSQLPGQLAVTKETALNQIEGWLGIRVITLSDLAARFDMAPRMHDVGPPPSGKAINDVL